ncbi:MAG: transcriptional repressor LexA [Nevskiaceae bacterium]|nr:MAG: transcriptional repressor LexA [Nevskiaceae bacterium]
MQNLTDRQAEILEFIQRTLCNSGVPPTRADICAEFGFSSPNAAEGHLKAIASKGYIELMRHSRGIRVLVDQNRSLTQQYELPLIGYIAAGQPILAEENVEETVRIDPELFHPRADFLHRVSGHSMKDVGILDGDLVGIHYQPDADNGQIIAAALYDRRSGREAITLKRYYRRGAKVRLDSENSDPQYAPIEIDLTQVDEDSQDTPQFRIAGLYAGLIRRPR